MMKTGIAHAIFLALCSTTQAWAPRSMACDSRLARSAATASSVGAPLSLQDFRHQALCMSSTSSDSQELQQDVISDEEQRQAKLEQVAKEEVTSVLPTVVETTGMPELSLDQEEQKADPAAWKRTLKLSTLFSLWYVLNVGYNIGNKRVLNALPVPWTAATVELFFGFPYVALLWGTGLRKAPQLSLANVKTLSSQAFFLAATHVAGVISFGAGAISFTHILKATEPVWSAMILAIGFGEFLPLPVYASLVPIIAGVGIASLKELSFTWLSFGAGTLSAVTSATKAILSKKVLDGKPVGKNLTPANMFAVLTILGFLFILPPSLMIEGPTKVSAAWTAALANGYTNAQLFKLLGVSGLLYYLYNEVAFLALSEVAPVTHAVTNTVKRVVIILASVLVFRNPVTKAGMVGSAVAILGATAYSIAQSKFKKAPKKKVA